MEAPTSADMIPRGAYSTATITKRVHTSRPSHTNLPQNYGNLKLIKRNRVLLSKRPYGHEADAIS